MRTRKNPCPADQAWPEGPKSREFRREAAPEGSQLNGLFPEEPVEGELRKSRRQRKRKRSPKAKPGRSHPEFLLGMSAENVWFDKPFYDRAEEVYREKLLDSRSQIPREFPASIPEVFPPCSGGNSHGNLSACHHVLRGVWLNKPHFDRAEGAFMAKSRLSRPSGSGIPAGNDVIPAFPDWERPPENGKPLFSHWEALLVGEVWLEKPLYDSAERSFYERLFPGNSRAGNHPGGKRAIPRIPEVFQARFLLHPDSEAAWLHKPSYDRAESRFFSHRASRAAGIRENPMGIPEDPTENPSQTATPTPATK